MDTSSPSFFTSFDGAQIRYDSQIIDPDGFVFVFLHGLGGDLTAWREIRQLLRSQGYSSVALDLRGHGLSSRSKSSNFYEFKNFSQDVISLISHEKIKKPILAGHCLGGMIVLSIERDFPGIANAIVLIGTGYKPPRLAEHLSRPNLSNQIFHFISEHSPNLRTHHPVNFSRYKHTSDINLRRILSDILHTSSKSYLLMLEKFSSFNTESSLKNILIPTLIIQGNDDSIFPPKSGLELKEKIPNAQLVHIPNANHILVINNPEEVTSEIVKFSSYVPSTQKSDL